MGARITKKNVNRYLTGCLGIDSEEVDLMPDYVKLELVKDDYALFTEFLEDEEDGS